jgi:hypothetical protein
MAEDSTDVAVAIPTFVPTPTDITFTTAVPHAVKRDEDIGRMYWRVLIPETGVLIVNGGCVNFAGISNKGQWKKGYRCRFYE